jgi:hypothetical protein
MEVEGWTNTIKDVQNLKVFKLNLVMGSDTKKLKSGGGPNYRELNQERGRVLAKAVGKRLRKTLLQKCSRNRAAVEVSYRGVDDWEYRGRPWYVKRTAALAIGCQDLSDP